MSWYRRKGHKTISGDTIVIWHEIKHKRPLVEGVKCKWCGSEHVVDYDGEPASLPNIVIETQQPVVIPHNGQWTGVTITASKPASLAARERATASTVLLAITPPMV